MLHVATSECNFVVVIWQHKLPDIYINFTIATINTLLSHILCTCKSKMTRCYDGNDTAVPILRHVELREITAFSGTALNNDYYR